MNKKVLIIACAIMTIAILSGCSLLGGDKNKEIIKKEADTEQNQKSSENKDGNYFETMTDLMARRKSMKCTYTQKVENTTANGVVYMADKNARVEITIKGENQPDTRMYALIKQDWHYSWTEGSSQGYKMTVKAAEMSEKDEQNMASLSKEIKFECQSWKKDNSKFELPTNVEFRDMSEMMDGLEIPSEEEMKDLETQSNEWICEHCKNAPASEVKECLGDVVCDWSK